MNADDMRRAADFIEGLQHLEKTLHLTIYNDYLWDEGEMVCAIDSNYEIRTTQ